MALSVKDNTVIGVEVEDTEGVYKAPTSDQSYVQTLSDGTELSPAKELVERNIFNGSLGKSTPRTGTRSVSGSMPVEMRAGEAEGDKPEYDALIRSTLGSAVQMTSSVTSETGHSASVLNIADADISEFKVGQVVVVKEVGAYHTSPVIAVDPTVAAANITLLVPASGAFSDNVEIAKGTTYCAEDSGHPSLSISKYIESTRIEKAIGARGTSMSLESFTTGQLASFNFGFEGLDFDCEIGSNPFTPDYDNSLPPIILEACVFVDGVNVNVNEVAFSVENTLGFATATCSENGRISGRPTDRSVSGSFNPYKQDDSCEFWDKFKANTEFSLFGSARVPSGVAGEYEQVVAFYMPHCIVTEVAESDQDGLLVNDVSFSAARGADGADSEVCVTFV